MTKKERAEAIMRRLAAFEKLERKNTDEVGWIAFAYSVSRPRAARMIADARALLGGKT